MSGESKHPKSAPSESAKPAVQASSRRIAELLSKRPVEIYQALGLKPGEANLSMPTDGRGPRIRASVKRPQAATVPTSITLAVDNLNLKVAIEVAEDFQEFQPL